MRSGGLSCPDLVDRISVMVEQHGTILFTAPCSPHSLAFNILSINCKIFASFHSGYGKSKIKWVVWKAKNSLIQNLWTLVIFGSPLFCNNKFSTMCLILLQISDELKPIVDITLPLIIFCSVDHCEKVKSTAPSSSKIIMFDSNQPLSDDADASYLKFSHLVNSTKILNKIKNSPDDLACILYSSATTGLKKGVMLTHQNLVYGLILLWVW